MSEPTGRGASWTGPPSQRAAVVVHVPSVEATRQAMAHLVAIGSPQPRFPCWETHQARALMPQPASAPSRADPVEPAQTTVRDEFFASSAK